MGQTSPKPGAIDGTRSLRRYMVVIYNNETNSFNDVVSALVLATGCELQEALIETWEAHTFGKASVHFAPEEECQEAAAVIARIGVRTEVRPEWDD